MEAREERKSSLTAYMKRLAEAASSSVLLIVILTLGIIATTIACLPVLLGLKFVSVFFADSKDIDSSGAPSSVDSVDANSSLTEWFVTNVLGDGCQVNDKKYSRVWELK